MENSTTTKSRNRGHDLQAINWVRDHVRGLTVYERMLLQYLATRCKNDGTHSCYPRQRDMASDLEVHRKTVNRYLKSLQDKGLVSVKRRRNLPATYTLNVPEVIQTPGGRDSTVPSGRDSTVPSGRDSQMHHKERTSRKESEGKNRSPSDARSPSDPCDGTPETTQDAGSRDDGETLVQSFQSRCKGDQSARLRFYMDCGRLHTDADHFHSPADPKKPLTFGQTKSLRLWFEQLPESGCAVMNFAMANWPRLRVKHRVGQTTPTISALEKAGAAELLASWQRHQHDAMLARVASKMTESFDAPEQPLAVADQ